MAHLLYNEPLLEQVKQEIDGAWKFNELDTKYLSDHCPALDATFNEALRHKNAAGAMRLVVADESHNQVEFGRGILGS